MEEYKNRGENYEYWYLPLPTDNLRLADESKEDHINRELTNLYYQGWEAVSITQPNKKSKVGFLFRRDISIKGGYDAVPTSQPGRTLPGIVKQK